MVSGDLKPRTESVTGASLSGSSGTTSRTYTLQNSNVISQSIMIIVENAALQVDVDFSLAGQVITFTNKVFNSQNITFIYYTSTTFATSAFSNLTNCFSDFIGEYGHNVVWRIVTDTLDTPSGTPTSQTFSDSIISAFLMPERRNYESERKNSRRFVGGKFFLYVLGSNKVQTNDWFFDKDEDESAFTALIGTSISQLVLTGDQTGKFKVNSYISSNDSSNTGFYKVTAVSFSSPNTTLTVSFDSDPGTGDSFWKAAKWKVKESQALPDEGNVVYRRILMEKRQ